MGEFKVGVMNGATETLVKVTRFAFCNLSDTARMWTGIAVEAPFQGAVPIMLSCHVWPRLMNDAPKVGTEITFVRVKGRPNVPC